MNSIREAINLSTLESLLFHANLEQINKKLSNIANKISLDDSQWEEMLGARYTQTVLLNDYYVPELCESIHLQFSKYTSDGAQIISLDSIILKDLSESNIDNLLTKAHPELQKVDSNNNEAFSHKNYFYEHFSSESQPYIYIHKKNTQRKK